MNTLTATTLDRGQVTKVAVDIRFPDGTHATQEHAIGPETGGILFDDALVSALLTGSIDRNDPFWKKGLELWNSEQERPSYLLLPRARARTGITKTCAANVTGSCVGGGQCRDTGQHCG